MTTAFVHAKGMLIADGHRMAQNRYPSYAELILFLYFMTFEKGRTCFVLVTYKYPKYIDTEKW